MGSKSTVGAWKWRKNTSAIEWRIGRFPIAAPTPRELAGALPYIVVGIGADTGREDACVELVRSLAPDTGMAFVLIPHAVNPDDDLLEILGHRAAVPVAEMLPGIRPEPNRLYVLPAGMRANLKGGIFDLAGVSAGGNSIDHFFLSLAASQKTCAVGVLLSGPYGDGTKGLRAIEDQGGIAIVQNPGAGDAEMRHDGHAAQMPIDRFACELTQIARRFRESFEKGGRQHGEEEALPQLNVASRTVRRRFQSLQDLCHPAPDRPPHASSRHPERGRIRGLPGANPTELEALHENLWCLLRSGPRREDERRRIARELHDNISQKLALLEMDAHQIALQMVSDPDRARNELERVRSSIGALSEEVRRISRALHPSVIEDLGLTPAIRSLVEDFRDSEQLIATYQPDNVPDGIPLKVATGLYKIAQEALRNIAKHAGSTHVKVLLTGGSGRIRLQVIDSGKGFDVGEARSGFGVTGMEEHARMIRGALKIESEPGEGTRVTVDVPWPESPATA